MASAKRPRSSEATFRSGFDSGSRWSGWKQPPGLLLTDLLILILLIVFPFVMGGREALGHRLLVSLSFALGCVWCVHRSVTGGRLVLLSVEPLLIAALVLLSVQTMPNSPETLGRLSAEYDRLLSGWGNSQVLTAGSETAVAPAAAGDPSGAAPSRADKSGEAAALPVSAPVVPAWNTASLTPVETEHGRVIFIAYVVIALVLAQRVQSADDCARMMRVIAVSGVLMATFAILQLVTSNDLFFWFYRHPFTGTRELLKGAFTNRNHFAQFLALSVGPLTWWMIQERRLHADESSSPARKGLGPAQGSHSEFGTLFNVRLLMLISATATVLLSVLLSLSRGGMLAAGSAFLVVLLGLWRLTSIRSSLTVVLMGLGFAVIGGLFVVGQDKVEARVDQLASADADKIDQSQGRRTIWKADMAAVQAFPVLGTGVGSHRDVYPIYMTELADFASHEFTHAESSYMQVALETGLVGVGILIIGLLWIIGRMVAGLLKKADPRVGEFIAAALAGMMAGTVHAAADFIWYVPAIVVTTIVLGVVGIRAATGFQENQGLRIPRAGWLAAGIGCGVALILVQPELGRRVAGERFYHQYLIATFDDAAQARTAFDAVRADNFLTEDAVAEDEFLSSSDAARLTSEPDPDDYRAVGETASFREQVQSSQRRMRLLMHSLRANPRQPRVQLHLAASSLNLFEKLQQKSDNPLNLTQISDVVASSSFRSREEMRQWLDRAFGNAIRLPLLADQLARQSLRACPVLGTAWLTLAETAFLRDPSLAGRSVFVEQALLVRGHDPKVRFFAGSRAMLSGNPEEALRHWAAVFHSNKAFRREITQRLSSAPASFLITQFRPDAEELRDILDVYAGLKRTWDLPEIIAAIQKSVSEETERLPPEQQISILISAAEVAYARKMMDLAERLLRQAIACDDQAYWPRRNLGVLLYETERYGEAGEMLYWCYQQQPGDARLDRMIREARRRSLRQDVSVIPAGYRPDQQSKDW